MANVIILEQTCECCPEQYWAYKGSRIIGYIRLRWGHLTCDYLPKGRLTDNDIRVYDKTFNERADDNFKCSFDTEEEREYWLSKCKEALLKKYNELKKKEITIDYEKAYKEALERAKSYHDDPNCFKHMEGCLEHIFPELKESEDERIRKELLNAFQESEDSLYMVLTPHRRESFIAWLEKQGKTSPILSNSLNIGKVEQKPADKVEPKFKIGDIITDGKIIGKVDENENNKYHAWFGYDKDLSVYYADIPDVENWHLWTIQDAKDGDVLSYVTDEEDLWIMIYWSLYEPYEGHVHYHALLVNNNFGDKGTCCVCVDNLKPATKEQRDLLFKKMHEAGYEWDAEKKELKKEEVYNLHNYLYGKQKPAWSKEDERICTKIIFTLAGFIGNEDKLDWLKSLKERVQPKQEWSEEDETTINNLVWAISNDCIRPQDREDYCDWLKSLRPQKQWKPSEEQLKSLEQAARYYNCGKIKLVGTHLNEIIEQLKAL